MWRQTHNPYSSLALSVRILSAAAGRDLAVAEGAWMLGDVVGVDVEQIVCDMPVEVVFDDVTDDVTIPKFKPQ